jgi:hypothetical protein
MPIWIWIALGAGGLYLLTRSASASSVAFTLSSAVSAANSVLESYADNSLTNLVLYTAVDAYGANRLRLKYVIPSASATGSATYGDTVSTTYSGTPTSVQYVYDIVYDIIINNVSSNSTSSSDVTSRKKMLSDLYSKLGLG